jgi:glutamine synthetase
MPKPIYGDYGSGMHVHFSLWKNNEPLFAGRGYAGLSDTAMYAMGGLLKHAPALLAITNPTTNSYKRLVPGFEAPVPVRRKDRKGRAPRHPENDGTAKAFSSSDTAMPRCLSA